MDIVVKIFAFIDICVILAIGLSIQYATSPRPFDWLAFLVVVALVKFVVLLMHREK